MLFDKLADYMKEPARKKKYYKSAYCEDLKVPYRKNIIYEPSYLFYNESKKYKTEFTFVHQPVNNLDYILFRDKIYLFRSYSDIFYGILYDDTDGEWKVLLDGDRFSLKKDFDDLVQKIEKTPENSETVMLFEQEELLPRYNGKEDSDDCAVELLPDYIKIVTKYTDILQ